MFLAYSTNILSIPIATPALVVLLVAIPANFPYHAQPGGAHRTVKVLLKTENRRKLDFTGAALLLLATLSLTAAFEEAGSRFPWKSAYVITLIVVSGVLWIALILWERSITYYAPLAEPVLPWRFFVNRAMVSLML